MSNYISTLHKFVDFGGYFSDHCPYTAACLLDRSDVLCYGILGSSCWGLHMFAYWRAFRILQSTSYVPCYWINVPSHHSLMNMWQKFKEWSKTELMSIPFYLTVILIYISLIRSRKNTPCLWDIWFSSFVIICCAFLFAVFLPFFNLFSLVCISFSHSGCNALVCCVYHKRFVLTCSLSLDHFLCVSECLVLIKLLMI